MSKSAGFHLSGLGVGADGAAGGISRHINLRIKQNPRTGQNSDRKPGKPEKNSPQHSGSRCTTLATIRARANLRQGPPVGLGGGVARDINLYCVSRLSAKCRVLSRQGREAGGRLVMSQHDRIICRTENSPLEFVSLNIPNGR